VLLALVRDESLRKNVGSAARKHIEDKFSFVSRLRRIETLYERIIDQPMDARQRRHLVLPTG
jgi:hypothetical protein